MSTSRMISGAFAILLTAGAAHGAEYEFQPSMAVSEEYTDNVFESSTNRVGDYITRTMPGIALSMKAPVLDANLNYLFDYRLYARKSRDNEHTHVLAANGRMTVVKNLLFLDASDDYRRVSLDVTRDVTRESLFFNQADRNSATVSPYLTLQPGQKSKLKAGYRFVDTRYFDSPGIDKRDHIGFADLSYEITPRLSATGGYNFTREESAGDGFRQHQGFGGFRYEYADKSFLFAQGGNTWTRYSSGNRTTNPFWSAGATHVFDTFTATLKTGVKYNEDPLQNIKQESFVKGDLEKRLRNGSLGLSLYYSEYNAAESDVLETRSYGGTLRGSLEFTSRLKGNLGFTADKYDQRLLGSYTRRFLVDSGISFLLAKQLTVTLTHVFVDYYSPDIASDNRRVNRGIIEFRMTF